jgi:hypothetical protein
MDVVEFVGESNWSKRRLLENREIFEGLITQEVEIIEEESDISTTGSMIKSPKNYYLKNLIQETKNIQKSGSQ